MGTIKILLDKIKMKESTGDTLSMAGGIAGYERLLALVSDLIIYNMLLL